MNIQITVFETLIPKADTEWAPPGAALLCAQVQGPRGAVGSERPTLRAWHQAWSREGCGQGTGDTPHCEGGWQEVLTGRSSSRRGRRKWSDTQQGCLCDLGLYRRTCMFLTPYKGCPCQLYRWGGGPARTHSCPGEGAGSRWGVGTGESAPSGCLCWAGSSRHPTTTHRRAGIEVGNVCWPKWGGCHHEVWLCPPGSQARPAAQWARPGRRPGPRRPPQGQGFWLLPGKHQAWAWVSAPLWGGAGSAGPPWDSHPSQAVTYVWGEVGRNLGASLKKYFIGENVKILQHFFVFITYWRGWKWVTQSCLTLCDPMDYTVHGILQGRILEWVAFPFTSGSSQPRNQTGVSCTAGRFFTNWAIREAQIKHYALINQILTCGIQSTDTCVSSKTNVIIMLDLDKDQSSYWGRPYPKCWRFKEA